jgi:hypothetical protein
MCMAWQVQDGWASRLVPEEAQVPGIIAARFQGAGVQEPGEFQQFAGLDVDERQDELAGLGRQPNPGPPREEGGPVAIGATPGTDGLLAGHDPGPPRRSMAVSSALVR